MRVLIVVGARPNFMKVAPILTALDRRGAESLLVHTGQHYDAAMSDAFFHDLGIRQPDFHLGVGSGTHAQQTARVMEGFEPVVLRTRPDWVVVVGDVNSTLACALVAAKLQPEVGCRIAHVEAGLRSGDWRMPEEINRVVTDRLSDLLLTPSRDAHPNLLQEGIPPTRIEFVGNVMIDTLFTQLPKAGELDVATRFGLGGSEYGVVTLHRPSNVDNPILLGRILDSLDRLTPRIPLIMPLHPRTRMRIVESKLSEKLERLHVTEPVGYLEMLSLTAGAAVVLTDSGGLQEETTALGIPCVTLREQTERPITVTEGTNRLVPWPLSSAGVIQTVHEALASGRSRPGERCPDGWDGKAAERVVAALEDYAPVGLAARSEEMERARVGSYA